MLENVLSMQFVFQISALKASLEEKDKYCQQELEKAQTNSDRDIFDLRRKLDKIDLTYQEQMENLNEKHEKEMGKCAFHIYSSTLLTKRSLSEKKN